MTIIDVIASFRAKLIDLLHGHHQLHADVLLQGIQTEDGELKFAIIRLVRMPGLADTKRTYMYEKTSFGVTSSFLKRRQQATNVLPNRQTAVHTVALL